MPQQSLFLCVTFSAASGLARVVATLVLAYPEFLEKQQQQQNSLLQEEDDDERSTNTSRQGRPCRQGTARKVTGADGHDDEDDNDHEDPNHLGETDDNDDDNNNTTAFIPTTTATFTCCGGVTVPAKHVYLACHLFLLLVAAILSIFGTLYGPVSIAVPVQTATCLLANVAVMGTVLHMRTFDKAQRTGTYVVFFSVLSLMDVGPHIRAVEPNAAQLLCTVPAMLCVVAVTTGLLWSARETIALWQNRHGQSPSNSNSSNNNPNNQNEVTWHETAILLTGMTMSNVGMATASKTLASLRGFAWFLAFLYYLLAAGLGVVFSVVSSTLCEQGVFTPAAAVSLLVVNMLVGLILWQDYTAIHGTWTAYLCCACLMCCGVYLLAEVDLMERYRRHVVAQRMGGGEAVTETTRYHALSSSSLQPTEEQKEEEGQQQPDKGTVNAWQATLMGDVTQPWRPHRGELLILPI